MLDERNSGLRGFDFRTFLKHLNIILNAVCDGLVHRYRRTETKRQTDNQTQRHLTGNLHPSVQTVFVLLECLDIIVCKTQCTENKRRNEHQNHIYIRQLTQQQTGH